jgi:hypothetical protein
MSQAASLVERNISTIVDQFGRAQVASTQSTQALVTGAQQVKQSVDISAESIAAMAEAMKGAQEKVEGAAKGTVEAATGFEGFAGKIEEFIKHPLDSAGAAARGFITDLGPIGVGAMGAAAGIAELGKQAFDLVNEEGMAVRQTQNFANMLGLGYEQTKKLGEMARLVDTDIGGLARASFRLAEALEDPTGAGKKQADALKDLGISADNSGDALLKVLQKLSEIPDKTKRIEEAHILLGRASFQLQPLIENYDSLGATIESLGGVLDDTAVKGLLDARQKVNELGIEWEHLKEAMAAKVAAPVEVIVTAIKQVLAGDIADISGMEAEAAAKIRKENKEAKEKEATDGLKAAKEAGAALHTGNQTAGAASGSQWGLPGIQVSMAGGGKSQFSELKSGQQVFADSYHKSLAGLKTDLEELEAAHKKLGAQLLADPTKEKPFDPAAGDKYLQQEKDIATAKEKLKAAEKVESGAGVAERNAMAAKQIEDQKKLALEGITIYEAAAKEKLQAGVITQAQETAALLSASKARWEIEVDEAHKKDALAVSTAKAEHKPAPVGTNYDLLGAERFKRDQQIQDQATEKAKQSANSVAEAEISSAKRIADAKANAEAQAARTALAAHQATIAQETAAEVDAATAKHTADQKALNAQLELAKQDPTKNAAKIIGLNAEISAAEITFQASIAKIRADGAQKQIAMAERTEQTIESATIAHATRVYEHAKELVEADAEQHRITVAQKIERLKELERQEYETQMAAAAGEYQQAVKKGGADLTQNPEAASAQAKIQQIADQYAIARGKIEQESRKLGEALRNGVGNAVDATTTKLLGGFEQWANGSKKMSAAMASVFKGMAGQVEQNLARIAAAQLSALITHKAVAQKGIIVDAKSAAVSVANDFSKIPYVGVVLGPVMGAATFAALVALGSFDQGGLVPRTQMAMVHGGESIYTEKQTTRIEQALGGGGDSGPQYHFHQAPGSSPNDTATSTAAFQRMMRDGRMRLA